MSSWLPATMLLLSGAAVVSALALRARGQAEATAQAFRRLGSAVDEAMEATVDIERLRFDVTAVAVGPRWATLRRRRRRSS